MLLKHAFQNNQDTYEPWRKNLPRNLIKQMFGFCEARDRMRVNQLTRRHAKRCSDCDKIRESESESEWERGEIVPVYEWASEIFMKYNFCWAKIINALHFHPVRHSEQRIYGGTMEKSKARFCTDAVRCVAIERATTIKYQRNIKYC